MTNATMTAADVREQLSADELAVLKKGFDAAAMFHGARCATIDPFPPAAPFVEFLLGRFYGSHGGEGSASLTSEVASDAAKRWPPAQREALLIGLLSSRFMGRGLDVAIHMYWGLMEGLTVEQIADTVLLVGVYSGMECFQSSLGVLRQLLCKVLKPAAAAGGNPSTDGVVRAMVGLFG